MLFLLELLAESFLLFELIESFLLLLLFSGYYSSCAFTNIVCLILKPLNIDFFGFSSFKFFFN